MYHDITYEDLARKRRIRVAVAVAVVLLVALLAVGANFARLTARDQAAVSVRDSILNAAVQCCAVEGSYPSSLAHLERDYGLFVNHADYVVVYAWLGDNVAPSVVVRPR